MVPNGEGPTHLPRRGIEDESGPGPGRFLPANAAGGIVRSGIYTAAAYKAGTTLRHLSGRIDLVLGVGAVVVIVAVLLAVRHSTEKLADKAELAYPGPLE